MNSSNAPVSLRPLSLGSIIIGFLGGAFYWWLPLGMVLSVAGLMLGIIDWTTARRRSLDARLSVAGVLISLAGLALDIVIASLGLQFLTFGGPQ